MATLWPCLLETKKQNKLQKVQNLQQSSRIQSPALCSPQISLLSDYLRTEKIFVTPALLNLIQLSMLKVHSQNQGTSCKKAIIPRESISRKKGFREALADSNEKNPCLPVNDDQEQCLNISNYLIENVNQTYGLKSYKKKEIKSCKKQSLITLSMSRSKERTKGRSKDGRENSLFEKVQKILKQKKQVSSQKQLRYLENQDQRGRKPLTCGKEEEIQTLTAKRKEERKKVTKIFEKVNENEWAIQNQRKQAELEIEMLTGILEKLERMERAGVEMKRGMKKQEQEETSEGESERESTHRRLFH